MDRSGAAGAALVLFLSLSFVAALAATGEASTECKTEDCKITVTIKIAFSYNESEVSRAEVDSWVKDIEDVWNGPYGVRITGDCGCEVRFRVETMKITDPGQINCDPGPPGYHCVMVTPWDGRTESLPFFYNSSGDKEYVVGYMGYKTQSPSQGGASIDGWWSDQINNPAPGGGTYHDAAHEAGHMMGLDDKDGDGLMTHTSGDKAQPTQDNIDSAVRNVCGPDACPGSCCCGNGVIDKDKGEACDPFSQPDGCSKGEACCPLCCSCFAPQCRPSQGEYESNEACEIGCKGGFGCYLNYRTGCWDCLRQITVAEQPAYDPAGARVQGEVFHEWHENAGAGLEIPPGTLEMIREMYNQNIGSVQQIRDMLGNEKINFIVEGLGTVGIVNEGGEMVSIESGELADPTMNMYTDMETVEGIAAGEINPIDALKDGRIWYEGVGLFNWLRFALSGLMFSIGSALGLI